MTESELSDGQLMFAFAHDLRGFLRTTVSRIQMVDAGKTSLPGEQNRLLLDEAVRAANDMNALIAAMVSYCDADARQEFTAFPLLLQGVLLEMKPLLAEAGAAVEPPHAAEVAVPRSVHAVVRELLTNCCRFRRPDRGLEVAISSHLTDSAMLEVSVADNGSGVDAESLGALFIPFRRMHSRREYPGFGLGLARCRKIVEAHGGTISAALSSAGGLAVTFTSPVG